MENKFITFIVSIPNAYCKKHDEIEPQDHDSQVDGLWTCPQCSKLTVERINGKKKLDYILEKLEMEEI